jgi:hypothetical protein
MQEYPSGPLLPAVDYHPPRRRNRLATAGIVAALAVALGVGVALGATYLSTARAAAASPPSTANASNRYTGYPGFAGPNGTGPGQGQGQCEALTVSSVSGSTIAAKAPDGSIVTVTTTASTTYTQNGKAATASAVKAGVMISVMGTHNSDGSITATSIDIR